MTKINAIDYQEFHSILSHLISEGILHNPDYDLDGSYNFFSLKDKNLRFEFLFYTSPARQALSLNFQGPIFLMLCWRDNFSRETFKNTTFEFVLENSSPEVQQKLLFHLDFFLKYSE